MVLLIQVRNKTHLFSLCGRVNSYHVGESSSVWASVLWASLLVGEFTGYLDFDHLGLE